MDPHQFDRRLAARCGDGVRGGHQLPDGRLPSVPVQDYGLRQDVEEDRQRDSGQRVHARGEGRSESQGPAGGGDGDRPLHFLRRRRKLAAVPVESAGHADYGLAVPQAREGTGDRDGRPRVLGAGRCRHAVSVEWLQCDGRCQAVPAEGHVPLRRRRTRRARRRGRRRESSGRGGGAVLPEGASAGRGDAGVSGRQRESGKQVLHAGGAAAAGRAGGRRGEPVPRRASGAAHGAGRDEYASSGTCAIRTRPPSPD